jgi:hypothetical protein
MNEAEVVGAHLHIGERMSQPSQHEVPSATSLGLGVSFLAGPVVVAVAGIGGHFGERLAGAIGYWVGCYLAAIVAALLAGWLFARLFRGHPLYWAFGALGLLVGGHLTWFALGGTAGESPTTGSDQFVVAGAALVGMFLGFAAAHPIVSRRASQLQAEPGAVADRPRE